MILPWNTCMLRSPSWEKRLLHSPALRSSLPILSSTLTHSSRSKPKLPLPSGTVIFTSEFEASSLCNTVRDRLQSRHVPQGQPSLPFSMTSSTVTKLTAVSTLLRLSCLRALQIVAPSVGITVVADTPFEVEWIGADEEARFDIDLHYCGSYSFCFDDDCGFFLASLCPEGDIGCAAQDGGYEVVLPEPIVSGDGYRVRVSEVGGDTARCSDNFFLMDSDEGMLGTGASITILSPTSKSVGLAGEQYTLEFEYDNGFGSSVGRFKIDLYESEGSGDCGTWLASICDKPERGCKDTQGDYDVVIPASTASGMYKLRVGLFGDDSVYGCSEAFEVVSFGSLL